VPDVVGYVDAMPSDETVPRYAPPHKHPDADNVLLWGILGLVLCTIPAPLAWYKGHRAVKEIDASEGRLTGRTPANVGRILGMVGTVLFLILGIGYGHDLGAIFGG
jgi:hypothetical protein